MSIEAMKQALDVIETYSPEYMHGLPKKHYTKALRQAIAEEEKYQMRQWSNELLRKEYERGYADAMNWKVQNHLEHLPARKEQMIEEDDDIQDYKRPWVGLTDEEIEQLSIDAGIITWVKRVYDDVDKKFYDLPLGEGMEGDGISLKQFANLVSTRLKEKNT